MELARFLKWAGVYASYVGNLAFYLWHPHGLLSHCQMWSLSIARYGSTKPIKNEKKIMMMQGTEDIAQHYNCCACVWCQAKSLASFFVLFKDNSANSSSSSFLLHPTSLFTSSPTSSPSQSSFLIPCLLSPSIFGPHLGMSRAHSGSAFRDGFQGCFPGCLRDPCEVLGIAPQ